MYRVGVTAELAAKHRLIGADFGAENELHEHRYRLEVELCGPQLGEHGFLLDITVIEERLAALVGRLEGAVLNELPELAGLNPSVEHLARVVAEDLCAGIERQGLAALEVKIWEKADAWASYQLDL